MKGKEASEYLNISQVSLRRYADSGKINFIRTPGNQRLYDVNSFVKHENDGRKIKVCYCRVSTYGQQADLENQINYMKVKYPTHEIISDVGSGINFNRPGLLKIIDYAIGGQLEEVVVAYKDRLCRIGYSLIENIITKYSNAKITIDAQSEETINEEIANDLLQIINVYSAKINGMRRYKAKKDYIIE